MNAHCERLRDFCAAQTVLRCPTRINLHEHASGALSLVREHEKKVRPSRIIDRLRQHSACESFDIQIFDRDQPVAVNEFPRFFVMEVAALVADVIVKPLKQKNGFAPAVRSFLAPRYTPLQSAELRLGRTEPTRVLNLCAIAQSRERSQSDINADHVRIERQWLVIALNRKQRKPSSGFAFDREGFDRPFEWSVKFYADVSDLREPQLVPGKRVTYLPKRQTVITTHRSEARITRLVSLIHATEESLESQVYTLQRVFQDERTDVRNVFPPIFDFPQLQILIEPRDRFALTLPCFTALLQRRVVQLAAHRKLIVQCLFLRLGGIDAVAICLYQGGPILSLRG